MNKAIKNWSQVAILTTILTTGREVLIKRNVQKGHGGMGRKSHQYIETLHFLIFGDSPIVFAIQERRFGE